MARGAQVAGREGEGKEVAEQTLMADWRARSGFSALALAGLAVLAGLFYLAARPGWRPTPAAPVSQAVAAGPVAPAFDIVRVDAGGNAVIAGHGAPGAIVTIFRNGRVLGTLTLDAAGSFAFLPDGPLPAGAQQLTLSERMPGGAVIAGPGSAALLVPARPGPALAVLSGPGGSEVLSPGGPKPGTLGLGTVDYDAAGHAIFSGTAAPGTRVVVALAGEKIGGATAGADGRWRFFGRVPTASGTLTVSTSAGAAAKMPFALETLPTALAAGHVVIVPGQNLWLIARAAYGHGNLYTLIYQANTGAIHDPDLIFPGQAFAMPKS